MHLRRTFVFAGLIALFLITTLAAVAADEAAVATPELSPAGGVCCSTQTVKIIDATPNATIYYTTNGETPTNSSTKYSAPIPVSKTVTIKAIAVNTGRVTSAVASATYTVLDPDWVLRKLDQTAKTFRSTTADFEFDSVETDPIPEKDVQKGTVYYERKGNAFQMAAHIREEDGKPVPKDYVYSGGEVKLYEKLINQVTTLSKLSQYESWFMLGFGASGKDLEQKWEICYLGSETVDGVKTEKLEMVPKDPAIRKNLPKVQLWIDLDRGISLKQILYFASGQYKVCFYFNIKVNQALPADAFTFKTDKQTVFVNR
ncbi:MAG: chitobiase/beta-hexosaminidase C-terminal domain-containing protein [Terracidiphilus sp.]|jgi:outer membrane lipoprotein-sorting protein